MPTKTISCEINVQLPAQKTTFDEGMVSYQRLITALGKTSPMFANLMSAETEEEAAARVGIDVLKDYKTFTEAWRALYESGPVDNRLAFVSSSNVIDDVWATAIDYSWANHTGNDKAEITLQRDGIGFPLDIALVRSTFNVIIDWSRPLYIQAVNGGVLVNDRALQLRQSVGWACWVPHSIESTSLPSAFNVEPMAGGTFIATNEHYFNRSNSDAIKRMNAVEIEMHLQKILPPAGDIPVSWGK